MLQITSLMIRSSFLILVFSIFSATAHAQSSKPADDGILQSLLNEVRLLRETLQRINLNSYRSQIVVERIRSQNERIARMNRMLEDTRDQIGHLQLQTNQMSDRAKAAESQVQQEADSKRRSEMEQELIDFKSMLDPLKQKLEQLREREMRLNGELQIEQGKLNELEGKLEAMEREIDNEIEKQRGTGKEKEKQE